MFEGDGYVPTWIGMYVSVVRNLSNGKEETVMCTEVAMYVCSWRALSISLLQREYSMVWYHMGHRIK
jgi:hypothetical protein